jgi:SAM-dependent methyltransferase
MARPEQAAAATHILRSTRVAYDTVAKSYSDQLRDVLESMPLDRAILAGFAELAAGTARPVADVGCGPGHVTAHLAALGCDAFGIDVSQGMIDAARRNYPRLTFMPGTMTALALADESLGAVIAWYSVIHIPPAWRPSVFQGFHRVLAPGGYLLLGFQVGDEMRHVSSAYGHAVSIDAWRMLPSAISVELYQSGFEVVSETVRAPGAAETSPQAAILARRVRLS